MAKKRNLTERFKQLVDEGKFVNSFFAYWPAHKCNEIYPFQKYLLDNYPGYFIDYYYGDSLFGKGLGGYNILVVNRPFKLPFSDKDNINPKHLDDSNNYRKSNKQFKDYIKSRL